MYCALLVQIEERISIDILEQLKDAFILADVDGNGKLDFDEFKAVFKMELSLSDAKVYGFAKLFGNNCYNGTFTYVTGRETSVKLKFHWDQFPRNFPVAPRKSFDILALYKSDYYYYYYYY